MSKSTKGSALRKMVAERMQNCGVPESGATVAVEHGTAALSAASGLLEVPNCTTVALWAHVNRLHAERGEAVLEAKKSREEQGFKSAAFQLDWQHVEDLTRAIVHYEDALNKAQASEGAASPDFRYKAMIETAHRETNKVCPVDGEDCDRCHGCRKTACGDATEKTTVGAECQKVINRLLEGLELIAEMPVVDPALNIPVVSVVLQYDEARETARLTLDQYARNGGIVVDRAALEEDRTPSITTKREVSNG